MIPSTLIGLALFLVLLGPGLAYVLRHERVVPARTHTAFRESLRVVFVSVACLAVTGVLAAGIRWLFPRYTPDFRGLVLDPEGYFRGHHVQLLWWALGLLVFAVVLGAIAADPRLVQWLHTRADTRLGRLLTGSDPTKIQHHSAWHMLFQLHSPPPPGYMYVGAQVDDGTYVEGRIFSWNCTPDEDEKRELMLIKPIFLTTVDGVRHSLASAYCVISARRIVRLDVSPVDPTVDDADEPEKAS